MSMTIAVTGASGFLGSFICRAAAEAGHSVIALVRPTSRRDHIQTYVNRFVVGDQADPSCWPSLLDDSDCLVHNSFDWAALKAGLQEHLQSNLVRSIELMAAMAPRQCILISSVAVHHTILPQWNGIIDPRHPLRPSSLYGACKAALEAHLWSSHNASQQPITIIRPAAVYGIDPSPSRTIGHPIVKAMAKDGEYQRNGGGKFVHVEDVASVVVKSIGNPEANGHIFNMADCYARWSDWAQLIAEELDLPQSPEHKSPAQSANIFCKKATRQLGVSMSRGIEGIREHVRELIKQSHDDA
ncbi:MAG: NAD(P)-dependent oxidoreductase [Phycisphaerales bacterium]|nr:NAD(P)-dependent oxidoreductase [Phycisphaerales bacterium]